MQEMILWNGKSTGSEQLLRFVIDGIYQPEGLPCMGKFPQFDSDTNLWITVLNIADYVIYNRARKLNSKDHVINFATNIQAKDAISMLENLPKGCVIEIKEVAKQDAKKMVSAALMLKEIRELEHCIETISEKMMKDTMTKHITNLKECVMKMPAAEATEKYIQNVEQFAKFATKNGNPILVDDMDDDHPLFWLPSYEIQKLLIHGVKIGAPRHTRMMKAMEPGCCPADLKDLEHKVCVKHIRHFIREGIEVVMEGSENVEQFNARYGPLSVVAWATSVVKLVDLCKKEHFPQFTITTQGGHKTMPEQTPKEFCGLFNASTSGGTGSAAFAGTLERLAEMDTLRKTAYPLALPFNLNPEDDEKAMKDAKKAAEDAKEQAMKDAVQKSTPQAEEKTVKDAEENGPPCKSPKVDITNTNVLPAKETKRDCDIEEVGSNKAQKIEKSMTPA